MLWMLLALWHYFCTFKCINVINVRYHPFWCDFRVKCDPNMFLKGWCEISVVEFYSSHLHWLHYTSFHSLVWYLSVPTVCVGVCVPPLPRSSVIWHCRGSAPRAACRGRSFWTPQPMEGWRETLPCWRWQTQSRESCMKLHASSRMPSADTRYTHTYTHTYTRWLTASVCLIW